MRYVTLVNRTKKTLKGKWDGREVTLTPGKHQFPEAAAVKFKEQNPVMGSEDPRTGSIIYKLGIEEHRDPIDDLPDMVEGIERWDRTKLAGARPTEVVPGDNGLYSMGRTAGSTPLPPATGDIASGFTDPSK